MIKKIPIIIFILIGAFLIRFWGLGQASYYIDEAMLLYQAKMIASGDFILKMDFNHSNIAYGLFVSYTHAFFMKTTYLIGSWFYGWRDFDEVYGILKLSARFSSVVFGTVTVFFVYLIGKQLFNRQAGLFSAFILAIAFNHITQSQVARVDILQGFFIIGLFYFSSLILTRKERKIKDYLFAGIFLALALTIKYNISILIIPLLSHSLAVWQLLKNQKIKYRKHLTTLIFNKAVVMFILSSVVTFALVTPHLILDPAGYVTQLKLITAGAQNFHEAARNLDNIPNVVWYLQYLAKVGLSYPLFVFVVGGIILSLFQDRLKAVFLLSYPFFQLILLNIFIPRADRYVVWWLPTIVIFAGFFLQKSFTFLFSSQKLPKIIKQAAIILILILIILPTLRMIYFSYNISSVADTRREAREFLVQKARPIYFLNDVDGKGMGIEGLQSLNSHELITASFNPDSPFPQNIFRFPGEYVLISSFAYEEYQHILNYNPQRIIFTKNKKTKITQERLEDLLRETKFVVNFMNQSRFVKEYSRFGFSENLFFANRLTGGSTEVGVSYNPTVKIFQIPKNSKNIPPLDITYYPPSVAPSRLQNLTSIQNFSEILDDKLQRQVFQSQKNFQRDGVIKTEKNPFPPGQYKAEITLRIQPQAIQDNQIYGYLKLHAANPKTAISPQSIIGKDLTKVDSYQNLPFSFELTKISNLSLEFIWQDKSEVRIEKIKIAEIK